MTSETIFYNQIQYFIRNQVFMIDYLIPGMVESNEVADFNRNRRFLHNSYVLVKPFKIRRKENEENFHNISVFLNFHFCFCFDVRYNTSS